jgi:hypothetical protein
MAVNNIIGGIMAKYVIGERPAIFYNEDCEHYSLRTYISEEVYKNIFADVTRCGFTVHRDSIDSFICSLLNQDDMTILYANQIYNDKEILAGERIRLYSKNAEIDLLKVRPRCYICTKGFLKGEIILLKTDSLDFTHDQMDFDVQSIAFLVPGNAYAVMDYKYLKNYRSDVASDISELINETSLAFQNNVLDIEFHNLLKKCTAFGVSIWTLMGVIDYLQTRTQY